MRDFGRGGGGGIDSSGGIGNERNQADGEYQCASGRDPTDGPIAICEIGRDLDRSGFVDTHAEQTAFPSLDDPALADGEGERVFFILVAVKLDT